MKTKFKKLTSALLAVIMIFGAFTIVPITASAATSGDFEYEVLDDGTAEITAYNGNDETLAIPSELDGYTVASIGYRSFYGNTTLTSLTIPDSVKSIGNMAFYACNLTSVTLGNGVTSIGTQAFMGNKSLANIVFGNSLTTIGDKAFSLCKSLESITIPKSVTHIESSAFNNPSETLTIYGYTGSEAEAFANENSIEFISLGEEITKIYGDVNDDGRISIVDATLIQKSLVNLLKFDSIQTFVGDVNGDGRISIVDATLIQKYLVHLGDTKFVGEQVVIE